MDANCSQKQVQDNRKAPTGLSLAMSIIIGLLGMAPIKSLAQNQALQDFAIATCSYKKALGNPTAEQAATLMLTGLMSAQQLALDSWAVNSGGKTY